MKKRMVTNALLALYLLIGIATYGKAYQFWKVKQHEDFIACIERYRLAGQDPKAWCEVDYGLDNTDTGTVSLLSAMAWPVFYSIQHFDKGEKK